MATTHIPCNKPNIILGFLQRCLQHCPIHLRQLAYKQFVLPALEYCSPIWDPYHQKYTRHATIEMVQHRAAHFVMGRPWRRHQRGSITAWHMFNQLEWPTLEERWRCAKLINSIAQNSYHTTWYIYLNIVFHNYPHQEQDGSYHHEFKFLHYQTNVIDSY